MEMLPNIIKRRKKMADDDTMPPPPKTAVVKKSRPPELEEAYACARVEVEQLRLDRDNARADNERALQLVRDATETIKKLDGNVNDIKAQCTIYQLERDEAVAKFAKLEAFLTSLYAQFRAFSIPETPIIRERVSEDAENTMPLPDYSSPRPPTHDEMISRINGK